MINLYALCSRMHDDDDDVDDFNVDTGGDDEDDMIVVNYVKKLPTLYMYFIAAFQSNMQIFDGAKTI